MPVALVALEHAVDDAKLANSVAILRYPLAMPAMPQELKVHAKRILADSVQARTGHRPNLDNADPQVTFEGGEVKFTLAGMPPEALGGLKPEALLDDVVSRTEDYVERVLTFTSYVSDTQELLDLESEVIKAAMEGFEVDEGKTAGGDDLRDVKVEIDLKANATAKITATAKPGSALHPVPMTACGKPAPTADDDDDADDADDKSGKDKKGKDGKKKKRAVHHHSGLKRKDRDKGKAEKGKAPARAAHAKKK